jgi:hypothetical protein
VDEPGECRGRQVFQKKRRSPVYDADHIEGAVLWDVYKDLL